MQKLTFLVLIVLSLLIPDKILCQDELLNNLNNELTSITNAFKSQETAPYFIDFRVNDRKLYYIQYSSGNLIKNNTNHNRVMISNLRIGNYNKDNTSLGSNNNMFMNFGNTNCTFQIPLDNDTLAMSQVIKKEIDRCYKNVLQQYKSNINNEKDDKEKKDSVPAFSIEQPSEYFEPAIENLFNEQIISEWKHILKEISAIFEADANIVMNEILLSASNERIYYLNTEGTSIVQNRPQIALNIFAVTCTKDKNVVPLFKSYVAKSKNELPSREDLISDCNTMLLTLNQLREAPMADPFAGPAILSSEASGVIFHEIFGHRVEGQRMKSEFDGHTFLDKLGKKVLLDDLSIEFNPTIDIYNEMPLFGNYVYDDEGVKSEPVTVVENGILKNFLMSRTPIKGHIKSNGHGRAEAGSPAFCRQSNLIVKFKVGESDASLRKLLIKECKKQKKQYGYFIKEVVGGFTNTMVFSPQVFNIFPTIVYRIYTDGRPDELVRGVTFIGTPLTVFSEIIAHGNKCELFNGFCGAESGSVPVSTVSPSLLIKKIETQKMPDSKIELPFIPKPN